MVDKGDGKNGENRKKTLFENFFLSDDEFGEKTVSILLDGEESQMIFIDHPHIEMSVSANFFFFQMKKQEKRFRCFDV